MARVEIHCHCGQVRVLGANPGDPGYGYGPDGYLPATRYSTTCSKCHPELDGLSEKQAKKRQREMGLR